MRSSPSAILLGSKPGAAIALEVMLKRGWDVKSVVLSPDPEFRWASGQMLRDVARRNGIPVTSQKDLDRDTRADFVISYMFRNLVRADVIGMVHRAAVNFHPAPLPRYGGWAFYNVAILEESPEYGCTCHHMDTGFDTGPILKVRKFPIDVSQETAYSLERRTQEEMIALFLEFCSMAEQSPDLPIEPQDPREMRYLNRESFEALKRIPDGADEEVVDRYARAFWYPPYEGAYLTVNGAKVEVVPMIAKRHLGDLLHSGDTERLRQVALDCEYGKVQEK